MTTLGSNKGEEEKALMVTKQKKKTTVRDYITRINIFHLTIIRRLLTDEDPEGGNRLYRRLQERIGGEST